MLFGGGSYLSLWAPLEVPGLREGDVEPVRATGGEEPNTTGSAGRGLN